MPDAEKYAYGLGVSDAKDLLEADRAQEAAPWATPIPVPLRLSLNELTDDWREPSKPGLRATL
ncbi:MAG: hypothetical protein ACI81R_002047 [Bradymonadia bacterium]